MSNDLLLCFLILLSKWIWATGTDGAITFGEEFQVEITFCSLIGSDLQVLDANGDGYDDLTCHTSNGTITISESHIVEQRTGGVSGNQNVREEQTMETVRDESTTPGVTAGELMSEGTTEPGNIRENACHVKSHNIL